MISNYRTILHEDGTLEKVENGAKSTITTPPIPALSEGDWQVLEPRLAVMTQKQLITLVRRMACQCGIAALMSREEIGQAMRDTLAETALKPIVPGLNMKADIQSRLAAIDKWLDRDEGKPMQRQATLLGVTDGREFMRQVIDSLKDDDVLVQNTKY